jgi:Leucine-rich repeat (LRR) protein
MKRHLSFAVIGFFLFSVFSLSSCGGGGMSIDFSITSSKEVYLVGGDNVSLTCTPDSTFGQFAENDVMFFCSGDNADKCEINNDLKTFSSSFSGLFTIEAKLNGIKSVNSLLIRSRTQGSSIAQSLQTVLDNQIVFGQKYDIGIDGASVGAFQFLNSDGILSLDQNGLLEVKGIGSGKLQVKDLDSQTTIFDNYFNVYNSILCTEIKESLIEKGIISSKSSNVTNNLLINVTSLDLNGQLINDPTSSYGIKYLTKLSNLDLSNNDISDLSFISSIKELISLNIANNLICNVDYIVDNQSLEKLNLSNNLIKDIKKLQYLHNIENLDISNNEISDVGPLSSLYSLKTLLANGNPIANFKDSFSGLEELKELGIGNCGIPFTDIISLNYLENLTYLDISGTDPNLNTIGQLTKLQTLILENCQLNGKNVAALNSLINLVELDISKNDLNPETYNNALDGSSLQYIKKLFLGGNAFTSIPSLSEFVSLRELDLTDSYNLLDLTSLNSLTIESLIIDGCNSLSPSRYSETILSLTNLSKLSLLSGFNYMDKTLFDFLLSRVANNGLSIRFLNYYYFNANSIENYKKSVFFTLNDFLSVCELDSTTGWYTCKSFGVSRQAILSLVNDSSTNVLGKTHIQFDKSLFKFDIYGNKYKIYQISFGVLDRKESSFSFDLHNFSTTSDLSVITSESGSKTLIRNYGISHLESRLSSGINCYDLSIDGPSIGDGSFLYIRGGNGANGANGQDGWEESKDPRNGKPGQNGHPAVSCHSINISSSKIDLTGGDGGNGGKGANAPGTWGKNWEGGDGGNGGNGGVCITYSDVCSLKNRPVCHVGNGGNGGDGGAAGGLWNPNGTKGFDGASPSNPIVKN